MRLFKKPSVSTAVAELEGALLRLDAAIDNHTSKGSALQEQIETLEKQLATELESANRAARIQGRLAELLV